jgi:DNA-binding IclR family transcriptional regulator
VRVRRCGQWERAGGKQVQWDSDPRPHVSSSETDEVKVGRPMADERTESSTRVADVLLQFVSGPETLGVSAIARDLDLSKAVVHRILRTLLDRDLLSVEPSSRRYRLGPAAAALGARALRDVQLRRVALPVLSQLVARTGETATVSTRLADGRVYLDQVISEREIKMTVELGRRFPLHAGSSGRAILAFLDPDEQARILGSPLEALTTETIVDREALGARLADVRLRGVAESGGERQAGAASLAAPVFNVDGEAVGALSVCGPIDRFTASAREAIAPVVLKSADDVSRKLGWCGGLPGRGE